MSDRGTILVVEDDENDRLLLLKAFQEVGVTNPVQVLHNGAEAIHYLKGEYPYQDRTKHPLPRLMLLDVKMPICNGFEVLAWRQTQPNLQSLAVVVLSGSCLSSDSEKALDLGATAFCEKPVGLSRLIELVKELREDYLERGRRTTSTKLLHCKARTLMPWAWLAIAGEVLKEFSAPIEVI